MEQEIIIFEATHRGKLTIGDIDVNCAVLENGRRIISQSGLFEVFDRPPHGAKRIEGLPAVVTAKTLEKFVTPELREKAKPIIYRHTNGKSAKGYDATLIPEICELYLQARDEGKITSTQEKIVKKAEIIIRALAKVGIAALIDEATGYQYDRERQELSKLLEAYISEDLMKWQRRFPLEYYEEIYRLYGLSSNPSSKNKPQFIGQFTNTYVYNYFPTEIIDHIKKTNPKIQKGNKTYRRYKNFQFLSDDIGIIQLDKHLNRLIPVMQLSENIDDFKQNFDKIFNKINGEQLSLNFNSPNKIKTK